MNSTTVNRKVFNTVPESAKAAEDLCRRHTSDLLKIIQYSLSDLPPQDQQDYTNDIWVNLMESGIRSYNPSRKTPLIKFINGLVFQQKLNIIQKWKIRNHRFGKTDNGSGKPYVGGYGQTDPSDSAEIGIFISDIKKIEHPILKDVLLDYFEVGLSISELKEKYKISAHMLCQIIEFYGKSDF